MMPLWWWWLFGDDGSLVMMPLWWWCPLWRWWYLFGDDASSMMMPLWQRVFLVMMPHARCFIVRIEELFLSPSGAPLLGHLAVLSSKPELDHALFIAHFLAALPHSNLPCMQPSGTSSSLGCYCSLYSAHCVNEEKLHHNQSSEKLSISLFHPKYC